MMALRAIINLCQNHICCYESNNKMTEICMAHAFELITKKQPNQHDKHATELSQMKPKSFGNESAFDILWSENLIF